MYGSHIGEPLHLVGKQHRGSGFSNKEKATCNCSNNDGEDVEVPSPGNCEKFT